MMEDDNLQTLLPFLVYVHNLIGFYRETLPKSLQLAPLANLNFERLYLDCSQGPLDLNCCLIVSLKDALKHQLTIGWAKCSFLSDNKTFANRWIKILISPYVEPGLAYGSEVLHFNLSKLNKSDNIFVQLGDTKYSDITNRTFTLWNEAFCSQLKRTPLLTPPTASEIQMCFIEGPNVSFHQEIDSLVTNYFSTPKYVCVGDVIAITVSSQQSLFFIPSDAAVGPCFIYFGVVAIDGKKERESGFLASKNSTNVYVVGNEKSNSRFIFPNSLYGYASIPPCLNDIFDSLKKAIYGSSLLNGVFIMGDESQPSKSRAHNAVSSAQKETITKGLFLLVGPPGSGKISLVRYLACFFNLPLRWINAWDLKMDTSGATEAKIQQILGKVHSGSLIVITNIGCLSHDRDGCLDPRVASSLKKAFRRATSSGSFVIATCHAFKDVSDSLWSLFTFHEIIDAPDIASRRKTFEFLFNAHCISFAKNAERNSILDIVAHRTAGFLLRDMEELIYKAKKFALNGESIDSSHSNTHKGKESILIRRKEIIQVLDSMQKQLSNSLGLPTIPTVQWQDVGGLDNAKKEVVNTIQLPIKHPSLLSNNLRRSGILFYGPPGTGKTLLAKSVASECGLNFISVKGPELLNMYVGQSEENVREVFSKARSAAPCVIFFDELDSLAPNRGRSGDAGGVMDRIVSALLAELDGVATSADVFVLAATNRPDLLDPALLRPGRFEKMIYLGICEADEDRLKILKAVSLKISLGDVDFEDILECLPRNMTGADYAALATDAFYIAVQRLIQDIDNGVLAEDEAKVQVQLADFVAAAAKLVPSLSAEDLKYKYKRL